MNAPAYLSWDNFQTTVFLHGQQRVHRVSDTPFVEIFGDGHRNRIGIWLEISPSTPIPPELTALEIVTTRTFNQKGRFLLEVATEATSLQRQFYHFAVAVAERVIVEKRPATEAASLELSCFIELLEAKGHLGIERQIGLIGELIFLEYLIGRHGVDVLDAWLGPLGEPHDFRLQAKEFEVKATVSTRRIHTIHGMGQLVPSKGCSLHLISVVLGPPGASTGFSLADKVAQISGMFTESTSRLSQFMASLEASGYHPSESNQYTRQFIMRRPMGLVPVDAEFPAITRLTIQNALGYLAPRIESLQYDVNVEGLGCEDGTAEFEATMSL